MIGRLVMAGISHTQAPQDLLELVAVRQSDLSLFLEDLREQGYGNTVLLSTCSRTEVYTDCVPAASMVELIARRARLPRDELDSVVEVRTGSAMVEHLFQVAAGLKSRVVGEPDVVAQVRRAYRTAQSVGMTGRDLERLFPAALRSAERAHLHTELGERGRSLACRAVDVGLARCTRSRSPRTLVVGSGHMAATATARLMAIGQQVRVAARNEAYAEKMVGPGAVCSLDALVNEIRQADLLICATSATHPVVTVEHVREAMRARSRELTVVDLSVPRNVDPQVARTTGVTVVEMAALGDDAQNDPAGLAAVHEAQTMVLDAAHRFVEGVAARDAGPLIRALREQVELNCRAELIRKAPDMSSKALDEAAHTAAGRLLHGPTLALRTAAATGDPAALLRLADKFQLTTESAATA